MHKTSGKFTDISCYLNNEVYLMASCWLHSNVWHVWTS